MQCNAIGIELMELNAMERNGMQLNAMDCNVKIYPIKRTKMKKSFLMVLFRSVRAKKYTQLYRLLQ